MEEKKFSGWKRGAQATSLFLLGLAFIITIVGIVSPRVFKALGASQTIGLKEIGIMVLVLAIIIFLFRRARGLVIFVVIIALGWFFLKDAVPTWYEGYRNVELHNQEQSNTASAISVSEKNGVTRYDLTATTTTWSDPIIVPKGYYSAIASDADCIEVMINGKIYTDKKGVLQKFPMNPNLPTVLRFRAIDKEAHVWVTVNR